MQTQELNLSFTRVTAPIAGRASYRRLAVGQHRDGGHDAAHDDRQRESDPLRVRRAGVRAAQVQARVGRRAQRATSRSGCRTRPSIAGRAASTSSTTRSTAAPARSACAPWSTIPTASSRPACSARCVCSRSAAVRRAARAGPGRSSRTRRARSCTWSTREGVVGQKVVDARATDRRPARDPRRPRRRSDRVIISGVQRARPGRKVTVKEGVVSCVPDRRVARREQHAVAAAHGRRARRSSERQLPAPGDGALSAERCASRTSSSTGRSSRPPCRWSSR